MNPYAIWRDRVSDLALDTAPLAVFDTETTGKGPFGPGHHRLVSIAVWHGTVASTDWVLALHEFCHPERDIPPEAQRVHGISLEQLNVGFLAGNVHPFEGIREQVNVAFRDRIPVAHRLEFDAKVLRGELGRPAPGPGWVPPGLCSHALSWAAWPHARSHSLAAMYEHVTGHRIERHHEAEYDALACFTVLRAAVRHLRTQGHPLHTVGELLAAQDRGVANRRAARAAHKEG